MFIKFLLQNATARSPKSNYRQWCRFPTFASFFGLEQLIFHFSFLTDDGAFQCGKPHMVVCMTYDYMIECSDAVKAFRLQKNASVATRGKLEQPKRSARLRHKPSTLPRRGTGAHPRGDKSPWTLMRSPQS